jgi:hypothetical protein
MHLLRYFGLIAALCLGFSQSAWATRACSEEGGLRSLSSTSGIAMSFTNQRSDSVKLYWLNFSGVRVNYSTIAPGATYRINSYRTHPWVVTDSSDQCQVIYLPEEDGANITIAAAAPAPAAQPATPQQIATVLDWVEGLYSLYFPPASAAIFTIDNWLVRYYALTGMYIGVYSGNQVYAMGGIFGNQPVYITTMSYLYGLMQSMTAPPGTASFNMTVKNRVVGGGSGPVPANIDFQVGQSLSFSISPTELSFNGVTLPFLVDGGSNLTYSLINGPTDTSTAMVLKPLNGAYPGVALTFLRGSVPFIQQISYTLE